MHLMYPSPWIAFVVSSVAYVGRPAIQECTVADEQKISETTGGFGGALDDRDLFGVSVTSLGDLDGNGVTDLAVGALGDDDGGFNWGAVWILFLNADGTVASEQKISATMGGFGGVLGHEAQFGVSVCSLGDLDSDGVMDLAVGAWGDHDGDFEQGAVWILFLNSNGTVAGKQKISATAGSFGGDLDRADHFGTGVAALGDLDGDGNTELAVGARGDDDGGVDQGAVWILFLNADGTVADEQKISESAGGFGGALDDYDWFSSVGSLGDLDGDGLTDLAVGAFGDDDGGPDQGAVWILFLNTDGTVAYEQKISATMGGFAGDLDASDFFGNTVAAIGDIDGNGDTEIAVSALADDDGATDQGAEWILSLNSDGTVASEQKISAIEGCFEGMLHPGDQFGVSVAAIGDINGDGATDLAIDAYLDDDGGAEQGAVWILFLPCSDPVIAALTCSPARGKVPLTVHFQDLSSGNVTSRLWDFGNGYLSTLQNPMFTYTEPGAYSITLTVSGPCGESSHVEQGLIEALPRIPRTQKVTGL